MGRCVGSLIAVLSVPVHCLCEGLAVVQSDTCSFHAYLFGALGGIRSLCVCVFVGGGVCDFLSSLQSLQWTLHAFKSLSVGGRQRETQTAPNLLLTPVISLLSLLLPLPYFTIYGWVSVLDYFLALLSFIVSLSLSLFVSLFPRHISLFSSACTHALNLSHIHCVRERKEKEQNGTITLCCSARSNQTGIQGKYFWIQL